MTRVIGFIFILSLLLAGPASAEDWLIQTVDDEENAGRWTATWLDSLGYPHIIYRGSEGWSHAHWTGCGWSKEVIGAAGSGLDVTFDTLGYPHFSYRYGLTPSLYYRYLTESGWQAINLGYLSSGSHTSIAFDSHYKPHIVGVKNGDIVHHYIDYLDEQWKVDTVSVGQECDGWLSIGIDSSDKIYISYNTTGNHLKLAYYDPDSSAWGTQYIDLDTDVGDYCELILDENGVPHIAYYDATNTRLKYATWGSPPKAGRASDR